MSADIQSLTELGYSILRAVDARGEWRPIRRCAQQLQSGGASEALALATANAMANVARHLRAAGRTTEPTVRVVSSGNVLPGSRPEPCGSGRFLSAGD